ncbi:MAG: hypothetical protein LC659_15175 [Myxococcales bacterium]|nr:hypothetical protein [Myxococcales bacterium]
MIEHPYRGELVHVDGARVLLAEATPPREGVAVRAWSDGSTRIALHVADRRVAVAGYAALLAACVSLGWTSMSGIVFAVAAAAVATMLLRTWRSEVITISPAAVSLRRRLGPRDVRALDVVSAPLVDGGGATARVELPCENGTPLAIGEGLGYDEAMLRWVAQRLRRAIEAARR